MNSNIQKLVAEGRTEEALALLAQSNNDAVLLQSRYNNGKKQYNMGLIEFGEWQRIQNQVNFALLDMSGRSSSVISGGGGTPTPAQQEAPPAPKKPKVFISYNHNDAFAMRSIKSVLDDNDIDVTVDIKAMELGQDIQTFINEAIRDNGFILSIVSKNSLQSGWVGKETQVAMMMNNTSAKNWLPIRIDDSLFDNNFYSGTNENLDKQIKELQEQIVKAVNSGSDPSPILTDQKRVQSLKTNFGDIITTLRARLVINVSGELFDSGMEKVVKHIKSK